MPFVHSVTVIEKEPVDKVAFTSWEQRNACLLPEDVRNFYSTTDGLQIKWSIKVKGEPMPLGTIEIVPLAKLRRVSPKRHALHSELPTVLDIEHDSNQHQSPAARDGNIPSAPKYQDKCRAFLLDPCEGHGKVCLVYPGSAERQATSPTVWYQDRALEWHYLAPTLPAYLRLALAHMGLPHWQHALTPWGPPLRTKHLMAFFIPERLQIDLGTKITGMRA